MQIFPLTYNHFFKKKKKNLKPDGIAIGLVLVAASPGGSTSQLYTYLSNGDVALSLSSEFFFVCVCVCKPIDIFYLTFFFQNKTKT